MTTTEIILLIGLLISTLAAYRAIGKASKAKDSYDIVVGHNKTLTKLYQQNHTSAMALLDTLNKNLLYQRELEEKNVKLTLENIQLIHRR